ncbi:MAG TPA: alpha/beta hydrolase [Ktedonobacterales bacterium]
MPTVKVNAITMYYELQGEGEPLVLIAGLRLDVSDYHGIDSWLAQKYQVLAFDNRGAGRTDKPDIPYSIEMMADDTAELLQALGIRAAHIIGISMGGRIALELALQHPELVKKLVLVSTSARVPKRGWRFRLIEIVTLLPIFKEKYPQPRYAYLRQRQASGAYNCADRLQELHLPTLILHGKKDKLAPYYLAEEMRAGIQGSKIIPFNGGHIFFFMRERQQFLEAIAQFLG